MLDGWSIQGLVEKRGNVLSFTFQRQQFQCVEAKGMGREEDTVDQLPLLFLLNDVASACESVLNSVASPTTVLPDHSLPLHTLCILHPVASYWRVDVRQKEAKHNAALDRMAAISRRPTKRVAWQATAVNKQKFTSNQCRTGRIDEAAERLSDTSWVDNRQRH